MGGSESTLPFKKSLWTKIRSQRTYEIMEKQSPHLQAQLYRIISPQQQQIEEEQRIYLWRQKKSSATVKVLGANLQNNGFGCCCSSKIMATVLTERIPLLLEGIYKLNERDEKILLYNCIKGFGEAVSIGIPQVNTKMIGINNDSKVKVWINEQFGTNQVEESRVELKYARSQNGLIKNILDVVRTKAPDYFDREGYYSKLGESPTCEDALALMRKLQFGTSVAELEENITSIIPYKSTTSIANRIKSAIPSTTLIDPRPNKKSKISIQYLDPSSY